MRIEINLKIFFVIILFFLFNYLDTYVIFFIFIFFHELAHLLWGILIGGMPKTICLNPLGISLELYSYGKNKPFNKIILFLIGPLINIFFAIIFMKFDLLTRYRIKIIYTNLALALFNLIPIIPLDGGKILLEIIKILFDAEFANKFIMFFSKTFLIIMTLTYSIAILKIKSIFILIILMYLWILYLREEKKYNLYERVKRSLEGNLKI